ncbi:MAG: NAD(P)/FAD-dependent oxidoreductase [Cyclobacteriaceae bacterium]
MYDVAVVGGGLAGLVNAILFRKKDFSVILFEEKSYPFHRVCGEYISNEVIPFLKQHDLFPKELSPTNISKFRLTSTSGKLLEMDLDLGGFGISRYALDHWLARKAHELGVEIHEKERVNSICYTNDSHVLKTSNGTYESRLTVGSFGKKTRLDNDLDRKFTRKKSPYIAVKYHIKTNALDPDVIELHNFSGGYCGASKIENDTYNLCYLSRRDNLKKFGEIATMEKSILHKNPFLKRIFTESEFLFEKPIVINEISFAKKEPVFEHILMSGDSAGMIAPLCGNGMAMAIHSSKILSDLGCRFLANQIDRGKMETEYVAGWNTNFSARHWAGRKIQGLFGSASSSEFAVSLGRTFRPVAKFLMSKTHGKPF